MPGINAVSELQNRTGSFASTGIVLDLKYFGETLLEAPCVSITSQSYLHFNKSLTAPK
jgi:hypothetical protein